MEQVVYERYVFFAKNETSLELIGLIPNIQEHQTTVQAVIRPDLVHVEFTFKHEPHYPVADIPQYVDLSVCSPNTLRTIHQVYREFAEAKDYLRYAGNHEEQRQEQWLRETSKIEQKNREVLSIIRYSLAHMFQDPHPQKLERDVSAFQQQNSFIRSGKSTWGVSLLIRAVREHHVSKFGKMVNDTTIQLHHNDEIIKFVHLLKDGQIDFKAPHPNEHRGNTAIRDYITSSNLSKGDERVKFRASATMNGDYDGDILSRVEVRTEKSSKEVLITASELATMKPIERMRALRKNKKIRQKQLKKKRSKSRDTF